MKALLPGMRAAFVLAAALALAACSALRVTYNNADTVLRYMAWEYFDLDAGQFDEVKAKLASVHEWHRASELPVYAVLARTASQRVAKGLKEDDIAWGISMLRARYRMLAARIAADGAPVFVTLSPEQLVHLEKKLAERNAKFAREFFPGDEKAGLRAQAKTMIDRFEEWTGSLSREQEARIERFVRSHTRYTVLRFEDRARLQRDAVALMRGVRGAAALGPRLAALFSHPDDRRTEDFRRETQRWEADFARLLVELDRTLTAEQRARSVRRLTSYADDFQTLAGERHFARTSGQ